jgi:predicted amino acid-binding ACT domain protein
VLATVTGRDRTGVTAAFFAALAAHDVDIRDVEQVVIRDRLVLTALFDLRGDLGALRASAMRTAHALGMECEVTVADEIVGGQRGAGWTRSHVIVVGRPLRHRDALCTCLTGGHEVWWDVEAPSERDALELLPHFVACRSAAHPVRRIQTP